MGNWNLETIRGLVIAMGMLLVIIALVGLFGGGKRK